MVRPPVESRVVVVTQFVALEVAVSNPAIRPNYHRYLPARSRRPEWLDNSWALHRRWRVPGVTAVAVWYAGLLLTTAIVWPIERYWIGSPPFVSRGD